MPQRIQRRRTKGWKMPAGAVYVGRPTIWGNPFADGTPTMNVENFRRLFGRSIRLQQLAAGLRGQDLACWCALDQPCHADVLLEFANR